MCYKKILITGANSYIGTSFEKWILKYGDKYIIDTVDTKGNEWEEKDFSAYDTIFHVAGIAHVDAKANMKELYYKVNTDLTVEVAKKAKNEGVGQFIFMSSIILFGNSSSMINKNTIPNPQNFYGNSKLQADNKIHELKSEGFKVVSIRPPMIYGKGSKGNYPRLSKLAQILPIFPNIKNERSMLHIDNLCEFIRLMIDNNESGFFYPQNKEYVNTADLVCEIGKVYGRRIKKTKLFNPLIKLLINVNVVNKLFGSLVYDKSMSNYMNFAYCVNNFQESIKKTEGIDKSKKALQVASVSSMIDQFTMPYIKLLQDMGYSVDVAANFSFGNTSSDERVAEFKKELTDKNIKIKELLFDRRIYNFNNYRVYKQLKKLIEDNNYDIVHCHSPIGGVITRLAARKARKNGTKVIYTAHGFHFFKGATIINWCIYYPIERVLARITDVLITLNKEDYKIAKNFKAKDVTYIPGVGVDIKNIESVDINRDSKRKELGLKVDAVVVLSVGELIKRKNHEAVIRALAKIKNPNVYYVICGQGKKRQELLDLAKQLGIENNVKILGFRCDIWEVYKVADIFAFPSFQEGLPVALMEAMASGLCVIASDVRGNHDLIINDNGGYLFDATNCDELTIKLEKLLSQKSSWAEMGKYNKEIMGRYDTKIVDDMMYGIYKKCF